MEASFLMSIPVPAAKPAHDPNARQLMIVDDEPELLQALHSLFEKSYMVVIAPNGHRAIELLQQGFTPQVILSDNQMPGIRGVDFLIESMQYVPDAVRVIMTGFSDIKDILTAIAKGHVYLYLAKPWQVPDLLQHIRICFNHHNLVMERKELLAQVAQKTELVTHLNEEMLSLNQRMAAVDHQVYGDLFETATALGTVFGLTQPYHANNHALECAHLAHHLGQALGLDSDNVQLLHIAALLHDIGKAGLPAAVLSAKAETLTGEARSVYESHVIRAADQLRPIERLKRVADIVAQHHEHIDGSGFPAHLSGYQVLREAQIIGLVDLYHNFVFRLDNHLPLTSEAIALRQAGFGEYLQAHANWYEPEIVAAFTQLAQAGTVPNLKFS
jgi:putative nucleotidyltransferase with HDIG domain